MNNTTTAPTKTPGIPTVEEEKVWTLYYRYGAIPILHKNFKFPGTLVDAIDRARHHCIKMGYKFICVRPFIIDLDEQEKKREQGDPSGN